MVRYKDDVQCVGLNITCDDDDDALIKGDSRFRLGVLFAKKKLLKIHGESVTMVICNNKAYNDGDGDD